VSDDDYYVSNTTGYLVEDLYSDERYTLLTEAQRTATLLWELDGIIRGDGIEGWIASLGQRSDDAVAALHRVGAVSHAVALEPAFALFPTKTFPDTDDRLSATRTWTDDQARVCRSAEDAYLSKVKDDDLIDNYVRPFIAHRPEDFPQSVEDL
jgi:hypothetical protein